MRHVPDAPPPGVTHEQPQDTWFSARRPDRAPSHPTCPHGGRDTHGPHATCEQEATSAVRTRFRTQTAEFFKGRGRQCGEVRATGKQFCKLVRKARSLLSSNRLCPLGL